MLVLCDFKEWNLLKAIWQTFQKALPGSFFPHFRHKKIFDTLPYPYCQNLRVLPLIYEKVFSGAVIPHK